MDASEVGRFGTLRLMKRLEPDKVVASYPIDDEEVTLGRDPSCSIRLYYDSVSGLHCKIIFRERKAFLVVLGVNGVVVDGCPVYPATAPTAQPVTVPLPNNSTIEIHRKQFQFCYPPKELRAALISTPSRPDDSTPERQRRRRKTLRMSMIQSAQVFTPRPSQDPRENLRILKTPIKSPFKTPYSARRDRRMSSPLKRYANIPEEPEEDDDEEDEDIVLVESNHPRVVEEDRDLVILEHVAVREPEPEPEAEPRPLVQYPLPQSAQQAPQTPPRRRQGPRSSLHRAVLLRSAHRTAMRREIEAEEEREAEEVEEIFEQVEQMQDLEAEQEEEGEEQGTQEEEAQQNQALPQTPGSVSGWRKSLDIVRGWAFGGSPASHAQEGNHEEHEEHEEEMDEDEPVAQEEPQETPTPDPEEGAFLNDEFEEQEEQFDEDYHEGDADVMDVEEDEYQQDEDQQSMPPPPVPAHRTFGAPSRPLGRFMTPQVGRHADFGFPKSKSRGHVRYSVGGFTPGGIYGTTGEPMPGPSTVSGPRRVRLVEPWKVTDITVPLRNEEEKEEEVDNADVSMTDMGGWLASSKRSVPPSPAKREKLSEEERNAIIQRRKSLLTGPDFFGGQTPGRRLSLFPPLSPMKAPIKAPTFTPDPPRPSDPSSMSMSSHTNESDTKSATDDQEDTSVLLARVKHMVEDAQRRQSMRPRPSFAGGATPRKSSGGFSLFAPDADSAPVKQVYVEDEQEEEDVSDKENDDAGHVQRDIDLEEEAAEAEDVEMEMQGEEDEELPAETDHDEDVEEQEQEPQPEQAHSRPPPVMETPRMDGLRHMFGAPRVDDATPSFRGVRDMFNRLPQPPLETPRLEAVGPLFTRAERAAAGSSHRQAAATFEGVGELLTTPAGYRHEDQPQQEAQDDEIVEDPPMPELQVQVEEHEDEDEQMPAAKATRSKKPPSKSKTPARRTSPRTQPALESTEVEEIPDEEHAPASEPAPAARVTRKPRSKGKGTDSDAESHDSESSQPRTRRSRKATVSPAPEEPSVSTRSSRRARTKTPTPTPEDAPATATRSSARRRARSPAPIPEEDEDADPIDSIDRAVSPEVPLPEPYVAESSSSSKVRRSARGKLVMEIKEEEEEEEAPVVPSKAAPAVKAAAPRSAVPRPVRGRKPATATAGTAAATRTSGIPRGGATTAARGSRTTPGLRRPAVAAATKQQAEPVVGNKENTPDPEEVERERVATTTTKSTSRVPKVAAPRTVGRTRAATADQPPAEVAGKTRVSRSKTAKK